MQEHFGPTIFVSHLVARIPFVAHCVGGSKVPVLLLYQIEQTLILVYNVLSYTEEQL